VPLLLAGLYRYNTVSSLLCPRYAPLISIERPPVYTPSAEHKGYAVTTDPFLVGPAVEVSVRPPKVTSQRSKVVLGSSRGSLEPVGPGARRTKSRFWVE
jgi:hypothetical protein